jgi:hypothetical protein
MFDLIPPPKPQTPDEVFEIMLNDPEGYTIHVQTNSPGHFENVEFVDKEKRLVRTIDKVIPWDRITGMFYFNANTFHKVLK